MKVIYGVVLDGTPEELLGKEESGVQDQFDDPENFYAYALGVLGDRLQLSTEGLKLFADRNEGAEEARTVIGIEIDELAETKAGYGTVILSPLSMRDYATLSAAGQKIAPQLAEWAEMLDAENPQVVLLLDVD